MGRPLGGLRFGFASARHSEIREGQRKFADEVPAQAAFAGETPRRRLLAEMGWWWLGDNSRVWA